MIHGVTVRVGGSVRKVRSRLKIQGHQVGQILQANTEGTGKL